MNVQGPRGTKDITIQDSYKWQYVEDKIRNATREFGYREIRTPIFEHTELFLRGVGETTDVVQKEMYTFEDKGGRSITLRPEGTAGAVRSFIESGIVSGPQPTKMYYLSAPVFRYEAPQAGRLREHHQFGVEVFGANDASIDAEVISLAHTVLKRVGVKDLSLNINSIGCRNCRPAYNRALKDYFNSRKGELCRNCLDRLDRNPLRILDCKEEGCRKVASEAPVILDFLCEECSEHFESLKRYLEAIGIEYSVNPKIVRGLDYYTKTVFEIISNSIGAQGTVCGGGRYDGLVEELGGPSMSGIGFGMGIERLLLVMEASGAEIPQYKGPDLFICTMGAQARKKAFELVYSLREKGISADMDHTIRSMKAQAKFANKLGAAYTLSLGDNEISEGKANLKNMSDGSVTEVSLLDFDSISSIIG
ncbi:MAG: histidine--tRNA ligase [Clostridia bacterium]|nr:histidine--tRNA ligase [Clostridia bacterium]